MEECLILSDSFDDLIFQSDEELRLFLNIIPNYHPFQWQHINLICSNFYYILRIQGSKNPNKLFPYTLLDSMEPCNFTSTQQLKINKIKKKTY
jgi:hypothetical protein